LPAGRLYQPVRARVFYEEMARLYLERIRKPNVTHFGDKTPEHLARLHRISLLFPNAKVILIFRDGRDVALSLLRLPWTSRDLYVNFALWLYCVRLQRAARGAGELPLLCVRYEDLVAAPDAEFRKILAFLDLPYEPQVAEGRGNTEGVPGWEYAWKGRAIEKINGGRIGLWQQQLSQEQLGILERWGGSALRELGYRLATDGKHALPWVFRLRVAWKSFLWLARRPRYAQHKSLWLKGHPRLNGFLHPPHRAWRGPSGNAWEGQ